MILSASEYRKQLDEALTYIKSQTGIDSIPVGIVLGTGLGALVDEIDIAHELAYGSIPHFPVSTVESHEGKLIFGKIGTVPLIAMQGRFHFYEGYSMQEITFPIRLMHLLQVKKLLLSNACGGMNPNLQKGDIVLLKDHINLLGANPLIGENLDDFGPRFPDMSEPYDMDLIEKAEAIAIEHHFSLKRAVYAAVAGPNLETAAEYRFLRTIGADVVGMSTVPEVIVAKHQNMKVLAMGVVTDECFPDALEEANVTEIIRVAMESEPRLATVMKELVGCLE